MIRFAGDVLRYVLGQASQLVVLGVYLESCATEAVGTKCSERGWRQEREWKNDSLKLGFLNEKSMSGNALVHPLEVSWSTGRRYVANVEEDRARGTVNSTYLIRCYRDDARP